MKNKAVIELGSEKIACIISSEDEQLEKKIRIIGFASVQSHGIKRAQIVDIQEVTKALEQCLLQAERMAGTRVNKAILLTSGPSISSQTSHGIVAVNSPHQEIQPDDIGRAVESAKAISLPANREIVHVLPKEFIVDGQTGIKNPIGMNGVRLEVETQIIIASSINLSNINKVCSLLGVEVERFVFSGLASANAVITETEKELGCVVADIGGGITNLCLYIDGTINHTAVIPIGSKNVSSDIAAGLRISIASAEKIKLFLNKKSEPDAYNSIHKKILDTNSDELDIRALNLPEKLETVSKKVLIDGIIKPRLEEISQYIHDELRGFRLKDQVPAGLIITGGGALTPFIDVVLRKELQLPVRIGNPVELNGVTDEVKDPIYASLVGALLFSKEEKSDDKNYNLPDFSKFFKNFEIKSTIQKTLEFLKSFIPGVK